MKQRFTLRKLYIYNLKKFVMKILLTGFLLSLLMLGCVNNTNYETKSIPTFLTSSSTPVFSGCNGNKCVLGYDGPHCATDAQCRLTGGLGGCVGISADHPLCKVGRVGPICKTDADCVDKSTPSNPKCIDNICHEGSKNGLHCSQDGDCSP